MTVATERRRWSEARKLPGFQTTRQAANAWKKSKTGGKTETKRKQTKKSDPLKIDDSIIESMRNDPRRCSCGTWKGSPDNRCPNCS